MAQDKETNRAAVESNDSADEGLARDSLFGKLRLTLHQRSKAHRLATILRNAGVAEDETAVRSLQAMSLDRDGLSEDQCDALAQEITTTKEPTGEESHEHESC